MAVIRTEAMELGKVGRSERIAVLNGGAITVWLFGCGSPRAIAARMVRRRALENMFIGSDEAPNYDLSRNTLRKYVV